MAPVYHTMSILSITFLVYQPFELVMEKSGVKTRSSEHTVLPAEADILLVTDSSSEEDLEANDQSYYHPEVYAQTWQGYITHTCICCIAMLCFYIIYTMLNAISLVDT